MQKHWRYFLYVLRHKAFVLAACWRRGILWRGLVHDLSKFRWSEWAPYAQFFYGPNSKLPKGEKRPPWEQDAFDEAWNRHQKRNDHHWQFWILRNDDGRTVPLPMPYVCIQEMLADWEGAGRAITGQVGTTLAWYAKNRDNMLMHEFTRKAVDQELKFTPAKRDQFHDIITEVVRKNGITYAEWTERMIVECWVQVLKAGDLVQHIRVDHKAGSVVYIPGNGMHELQARLDTMKNVVREIIELADSQKVLQKNDRMIRLKEMVKTGRYVHPSNEDAYNELI